MTSQADFYQVTDTAETARLKLVCRLADKAFQAKQTVYIHCTDAAETQIMDDLIWTFHDVGFIPHAQVGAAQAAAATILIGSGELPNQAFDILLNLNSVVPNGAEKYTRIIEVVAANDAAKAIASEHEKIYIKWQKTINKHEIK